MTHYFTRKAVQGLPDAKTIDAGLQRFYRQNHDFIADLASIVGDDVVASAYFDGDIDGLRDAYVTETGRTDSDFEDMMEHTSKNKWRDANKLLSSAPTPTPVPPPVRPVPTPR